MDVQNWRDISRTVEDRG